MKVRARQQCAMSLQKRKDEYNFISLFTDSEQFHHIESPSVSMTQFERMALGKRITILISDNSSGEQRPEYFRVSLQDGWEDAHVTYLPIYLKSDKNQKHASEESSQNAHDTMSPPRTSLMVSYHTAIQQYTIYLYHKVRYTGGKKLPPCNRLPTM